MNIDLSNNIKVATNYNFKKYRDGVLIQEENTHNVICDYFYWSTSAYMAKATLHVGSGEGTPATTDTQLFNKLWEFSVDSTTTKSHVRTEEEPEEWCQLIKKFTIPATSSYVGTITECGLYCSNLLTHALISDAEGNPISIEKTDLDIIIVEITVRFYFNDTETIKMVPADRNMFMFALTSTEFPFKKLVCNNIEVLWSCALPVSGKDTIITNGGNQAPTYYASNVSTTLKTTNDRVDTKVRKVSIEGARLGADFPVTGQHFIKGLRVANTFMIPFPNEDIFPRYEVTGMDVGVGDGVQTEFVCPMNYFINETDKVYINDVLQTRGVDYIVESDNNNQGCAELMASNEAQITGGYLSNSQSPDIPIFRAALNAAKPSAFRDGWGNTSTRGNYSDYPIGFNTEHPLFIDMGIPVKVNYLQIGLNYCYTSSNGGAKVTLWASDDGVSYDEVTSVVRTSATTSKLTFDTIIKQYFKVTIEYVSSSNNMDSGNIYSNGGMCSGSTTQAATDYNALCLLGYIGHGIQFTNPPESGAIITMDASTDLPMKNENFVFDISMTLQY